MLKLRTCLNRTASSFQTCSEISLHLLLLQWVKRSGWAGIFGARVALETLALLLAFFVIVLGLLLHLFIILFVFLLVLVFASMLLFNLLFLFYHVLWVLEDHLLHVLFSKRFPYSPKPSEECNFTVRSVCVACYLLVCGQLLFFSQRSSPYCISYFH